MLKEAELGIRKTPGPIAHLLLGRTLPWSRFWYSKQLKLPFYYKSEQGTFVVFPS